MSFGTLLRAVLGFMFVALSFSLIQSQFNPCTSGSYNLETIGTSQSGEGSGIFGLTKAGYQVAYINFCNDVSPANTLCPGGYRVCAVPPQPKTGELGGVGWCRSNPVITFIDNNLPSLGANFTCLDPSSGAVDLYGIVSCGPPAGPQGAGVGFDALFATNGNVNATISFGVPTETFCN